MKIKKVSSLFMAMCIVAGNGAGAVEASKGIDYYLIKDREKLIHMSVDDYSGNFTDKNSNYYQHFLKNKYLEIEYLVQEKGKGLESYSDDKYVYINDFLKDKESNSESDESIMAKTQETSFDKIKNNLYKLTFENDQAKYEELKDEIPTGESDLENGKINDIMVGDVLIKVDVRDDGRIFTVKEKNGIDYVLENKKGEYKKNGKKLGQEDIDKIKDRIWEHRINYETLLVVRTAASKNDISMPNLEIKNFAYPVLEERIRDLTGKEKIYLEGIIFTGYNNPNYQFATRDGRAKYIGYAKTEDDQRLQIRGEVKMEVSDGQKLEKIIADNASTLSVDIGDEILLVRSKNWPYNMLYLAKRKNIWRSSTKIDKIVMWDSNPTYAYRNLIPDIANIDMYIGEVDETKRIKNYDYTYGMDGDKDFFVPIVFEYNGQKMYYDNRNPVASSGETIDGTNKVIARITYKYGYFMDMEFTADFKIDKKDALKNAKPVEYAYYIPN